MVHGLPHGAFSSVKRSLAETVASWPPSSLTSASNFATNPLLAKEFVSYDSYVSYFEPIMLQELAAELASALEKYQKCPPTSLSDLKKSKRLKGRREATGDLINVTVRRIRKEHGTTIHAWGYTAELEATDGVGLGFRDADVLAIWEASAHDATAHIPASSQLGVVARGSVKKGNIKVRVVSLSHRVGVKRSEQGKRSNGRTTQEKPIYDSALQGHMTSASNIVGKGDSADDGEVREWIIVKLGSLVTMQREHEALCQMKNSPLLQELLAPKSNSGRARVDESSYMFARAREYADMVVKKLRLNASQHGAINAATATTQGFNIIQGPPGTGKTRTLVALLNVLHMTQYQNYYEGLLLSLEPKTTVSKAPTTKAYERAEEGQPKKALGSSLQDMKESLTETLSTLNSTDHDSQTRPARPRLLICAPSNAAVDEIVSRIVESGFMDGQGRRYSPELVRTGSSERVSNSARLLTSEGQAAGFLEPLHPAASNAKESVNDTSPAAKAQKRFLGSWQAKVNSLLVQLQQTPKTREKRPLVISLHEQLERMERDLRRFSFAAAPTLTREEKLKAISATYVEDAQLVFCTLSGSAPVIRTMKKLQAEANGEGASLFDTVVIDEAAQTSEPSCLIPLTAKVDRCILVGDPQQLPATVFSSGESGLAYGQSLLERICKSGKSRSFLDTQYRMHPAVSSFPRRYFYQNHLKDAESVLGENCSKPWHHGNLKPKLGPYVFIDVTAAPERRSRTQSILNPTEAELAVMLYKNMKRSYASDPLFTHVEKKRTAGFGIITPYGAQKVAIRAALERSGIPTGEVEVDTVDAFQGREKEVVIFSCVRSNRHRGIGFVQDIRRMNVGLTRARSTLIVLGDGSSLSAGSADWRELIEDAQSRGCYFRVTKLSEALLPTDTTESTSPEGQARIIETSRKGKEVMGKEVMGKERNPTAVSQPKSKHHDKSKPLRGLEKPSHSSASKARGNKPKSNVGSKDGGPSRPDHNQATKKKTVPLWARLKDQERIEESLTNLFQQTLNDERNATEAARNAKHMTDVLAAINSLGLPTHPSLLQTLTSHVANGGEVDFETTLAAALACKIVSPQAAAQLTMRREAEAKAAKSTTMKRPRAQKNHPSRSRDPSQLETIPVSPSDKQREESEGGSGGNDRGQKGDEKKKSNANGTELLTKRKRQQGSKDDGSGWGMLFSKRKKKADDQKKSLNSPGLKGTSVSELEIENGKALVQNLNHEEKGQDGPHPLFFVDRKPTNGSQKGVAVDVNADIESTARDVQTIEQRSSQNNEGDANSTKKERRGPSKGNRKVRRPDGSRKPKPRQLAGRGQRRRELDTIRHRKEQYGHASSHAGTVPPDAWPSQGTNVPLQVPEQHYIMPASTHQPQVLPHMMNFPPSQFPQPTAPANMTPHMFSQQFPSVMNPGFVLNQGAVPTIQPFPVVPSQLPPSSMHGIPSMIPGMPPPIQNASTMGMHPPPGLGMVGGLPYAVPGNGAMSLAFNQAPVNSAAHPLQNFNPPQGANGNSTRRGPGGARKKRRYYKRK